MDMAGMKRAAKIMLKGGSDLEAVIIDQKCMKDVISSKLIPSINNVGTALLKWSYTESNYTFPDVFSAWADLDAGFMQLLQEFLEECSRYRQCFKDIIAEAKKVSDAQKEKDKTASKVAGTSTRLEGARKTAKKNESNERAKTVASNLEADLTIARMKDEETEELLRNTISNFELYKASMLKDSLTTHCQALKSLLQKGMDMCQTKLEIAESMPVEPAMTPDVVADSGRKVEEIFNKYHLQLPPRDPTVERNLPAQRFKTLPPPHLHQLPKSPRLASVTEVENKSYSKPVGGVSVFNYVSDGDDGEDDDDYMVPNEDIIPESPAKEKPPDLPPRKVEEDEYVIPSLGSLSPPGRQVLPTSPQTQSDYFEVISDDEAPMKPTRPSDPRRPPHIRLPSQKGKENPVPVNEPIYTAPPEESSGEDYDQLYGNMTNDELKEHQRKLSLPVQPAPYVKPRKPAIYPKPFKKSGKEMPSPSRQDSPSQDEQVAVEDDDIYSIVCEDESSPHKAGGSRPVAAKRHIFSDTKHPGHDRLAESPESETMHTYMSQSFPSRSHEYLSRERHKRPSELDFSETETKLTYTSNSFASRSNEYLSREIHERPSKFEFSETEAKHTYTSNSLASRSFDSEEECRDWPSDTDSEIEHTYYNTHSGDEQISGNDDNSYGIIPDTYLKMEKKPIIAKSSPIIAKKPPAPPRKPVVPLRDK